MCDFLGYWQPKEYKFILDKIKEKNNTSSISDHLPNFQFENVLSTISEGSVCTFSNIVCLHKLKAHNKYLSFHIRLSNK